MEVLSSRLIITPSDFERSKSWYTDVLGLRIYREYGIGGRVTGVVFFCGGGFLELTTSVAGGDTVAATRSVVLWVQVPDLAAEHRRLAATREVVITAPPAAMPWGLEEMWIEDPDGMRIVLVEVPEGHPIRTRVD